MNEPDYQLSPEQIRFFDTFGFLSFPGMMADRIAEITDEFESLWAARGAGHAGKPHDGTARSCIVPFIDQSERLSALLDDPRIHGIAVSLLGDDFNYMGSDGNYYVGDTNWHSDGWHRDILNIKIAFYLDPVTRNSGALRVVPGSHKIGDSYAEILKQQLPKSQENLGVLGRDVPAVALETQPGDIVLFNHNTKHASYGGNNRRRMFTINFCQRYPENRLGELREYIKVYARFWIERVYGEKMVASAGPQRKRHLEQVMENDGHLAELCRQAREKMTEPSRG